MTNVWVTVAVVGAGTAAIKALGPVALGGRPLPERFTNVVSLLAPALLSALVAVQALGVERSIVLDERLLGLAAAGIAIWRKAPLLVVVIVAAAVTALVRLSAATGCAGRWPPGFATVAAARTGRPVG